MKQFLVCTVLFVYLFLYNFTLILKFVFDSSHSEFLVSLL